MSGKRWQRRRKLDIGNNTRNTAFNLVATIGMAISGAEPPALAITLQDQHSATDAVDVFLTPPFHPKFLIQRGPHYSAQNRHLARTLQHVVASFKQPKIWTVPPM